MSVYLVGAGPGDADLLTLRAARLLGDADVVVHDRLVSASVLAYRRRDARVIDVGKRVGEGVSQGAINELLIRLASQFDAVVRLKGGDPFLFGRGGEEADALRAANVDYEVVPGVSSVLAAPLAAGIPVTHRGVSGGVVIVSGVLRRGESRDLRALATLGLTIVIVMGVATREEIVTQLLEGAMAPSTPCAAVEWAFTERQRTTRGRLGDLARWSLEAPAVIVVGEVAALNLASGDARTVAFV